MSGKCLSKKPSSFELKDVDFVLTQSPIRCISALQQSLSPADQHLAIWRSPHRTKDRKRRTLGNGQPNYCFCPSVPCYSVAASECWGSVLFGLRMLGYLLLQSVTCQSYDKTVVMRKLKKENKLAHPVILQRENKLWFVHVISSPFAAGTDKHITLGKRSQFWHLRKVVSREKGDFLPVKQI